MRCKVGYIRRLIAEIAADEALLSKLEHFCKRKGFGWDVWRTIVKQVRDEMSPEDVTQDPEMSTGFPYYSDRANERYYWKPVDVGEIVIAEDWPELDDLWLVLDHTKLGDIIAQNLRTGESKPLTSWRVIPNTDVINKTIELISKNGAVDWRPDETLPEDYYAL